MRGAASGRFVLTRTQIVDTLTTFPERLRRATAGFDTEAARNRPPSGDWSVIELVCHLRDYGEIFNSRLMRALSEDNPRVASYDNEDLAASREYASQDLEQVIIAATRIRTSMLTSISRLTQEDWRRTVQHATWGEPTVEWLLNRCAEHELEHLEEIERLKD